MAATTAAEFATTPTPTMATANPKASLIDAMEDVVFGSIAGVAGKYIEYPFDTVKVRLQSQPDHLPLRYTGPLDCFRQSIRTEGPLGLYRGISAPLVGAALETSSLFFWESVGREWLLKPGAYRRDQPLPLSALWITGAFSGAFTSLVLTPVELVKCKIQVPAHAISAGVKIKAPTVTSVIREVWAHQGLRGFWNGQLGTLIRETGGCAAWFGSKETTTSFFRSLRSSKYPHIPKEEPLPLYQQALAGASAGMSYNFLFFPADPIKSRMQTVSTQSTAAKVSFMEVGKSIWKSSGVRGLYRGCGITVARSAPSSAFIFIIFDWLKGRFHQG